MPRLTKIQVLEKFEEIENLQSELAQLRKINRTHPIEITIAHDDGELITSVSMRHVILSLEDQIAEIQGELEELGIDF